MIKDLITACILFVCVSLSWIVEKLGFNDAKFQKDAYELGMWLALLTFAIWAVTEVRGNRVYIWLFGVITAGMTIPNLIFIDLKLTLLHAIGCYLMAGIGVFLYRKYK